MNSSFLLIIVYYLIFLLTVAFIAIYFLTLIANLWAKVPFVPTRKRIVDYIVSLADLKKGEIVYDLGCGDGRFLLEAEKTAGTRGFGYENALLPYLLARLRKYFSKAKMVVKMQNFFRADLSDADVIYCYLGPDAMSELGKKFRKECRKGTRIYSNSFSIKDMQPAKTWPRDPAKRLPAVYLYRI